MKKLYKDTRILDQACREKYFLSEDLMMENAAAALESAVMAHIFNPSNFYLNRAHCLILCGSGNNGGDGYALARRLIQKNIAVTICDFGQPKTEIAQLQKQRADSLAVSYVSFYELDEFIEEKSLDLRVAVDCVFGSGFHGQLPAEVKIVFDRINSNTDLYKIACDIPSGLYFNADETVTMGALKLDLFKDRAKDVCGKITLANLGVAQNNFENAAQSQPDAWLLEESDMTLPIRKKENVNKGSFGHLALICGEKRGAANIAGLAALNFGAGLVTLVSSSEVFFEDSKSGGKYSEDSIDYELMTSDTFPANTSALVFGMGLGRNNKQGFTKAVDYLEQNANLNCLIDADAFYYDEIKTLLDKRCSQSSENKCITILTPHPKEFSVLLEKCGMGSFTVEEVVENRFELVKKFCDYYKNVVLILKGANVLIGNYSYDKSAVQIYINSFGTTALSKAGSGDVLCGLAGALLAQKRGALDSAVSASLAHALASRKVKNNFALTPRSLIENITQL
jgi:hydroxyethylthiazole kinase-like uncharacterized protein yjeF